MARVLIAVGGVFLFIFVGFAAAAWLLWLRFRGERADSIGLPLSMRVTSLEVASWKAADCGEPSKRVLKSSVEGGAGTRCIEGTSEIRARIPVGRLAKKADLCLEIANSQCDRLMAVLRGHEIAQ